VITVIFASFNRAHLLPEVLASFARITAPRAGWRLIVADNGSKDHTGQVVDSFRDLLPLEYVFVAQPGKNASLNAALDLAERGLIVLTDDDVFPRADWLLRLEAAAVAQPAYSIFGGVVVPRWAEPPSDWILSWVPQGPTFTVTDPATAEGPIGSDSIFGPNMAVRSSVFESGLRFDSSIGPRGPSYAMGSETEFVRRALAKGFRAWFVRDAIVEHLVAKTQMQEEWILRRAVRYGRGQYRLSTKGTPDSKTVFGVPRYLFRQLASTLGELMWARLALDSRHRFELQWTLSYLRGQFIEARLLRDERRAAGDKYAEANLGERAAK
jgi:glycosyltransferase involved in cell wall biosynthesis